MQSFSFLPWWMASRMRPNAILCPRTFSKVFVLHIYIEICYFFRWNVQHFYFEYSSVVELNFKHNYKTMHAKSWMRIESLGERPWTKSDVFRPLWNPSTYLVWQFLPNKFQFRRSFWAPLLTYPKIGRHLWTFPCQKMLSSCASIISEIPLKVRVQKAGSDLRSLLKT